MRYFFIALLIGSIAFAQQFEKISEGDHVAEGGDSRSVNWIDYDNDGDLDLFVSNGKQGGENNFFYKNNGDGTFTKITGIAITSDASSSDGSTWGDFDNDGHADLFVTNWYNQNNLLYKNNGDDTFTFLNTSPASTQQGYSESASWGDYNNDGFIDLYVTNSFGQRNNFLYKNINGVLAPVTGGAAVTHSNFSRNVDWIDINGDNLLDIFVTNEENQNENVYINNGTDNFENQTIPSLLNFGGNSTSSSWGDIDNDGDFDLFVANYGGGVNFLFINNGDGTFTKVTSGDVVTDPANSFGSAFADVDNDGDLDLFVTNAFAGTQKLVNYFYLNDGFGNFTRSDDIFAADSGWSYGCAFGDYNNDGWLDLFTANCFGTVQNNSLYKNTGGSHNFLILNVEGVFSNRSAIGAIIKAKANINGSPMWQMRRVAGQSGYCGQNLQIHFGLAGASQIDSLMIQWPSGIEQVLENIPANQFLKIIEDTTLTSIGDENLLPSKFKLEQNYPNPFNPSTKIKYSVPSSVSSHEPNAGQNQLVSLKIYDTLGNEAAILVSEYKSAGEYEAEWNAENFSSGVYFYKLTAGEHVLTKKMVLIR
jgi:enediyne biosynthesis protein E4